MIVRNATPDDWDAIFDLGDEMQDESIIKYPPIDRDYTRESFGKFVDGETFEIFVAEASNKIVGFMMAVISPHFFTKEVEVEHYIFYVHPTKRGSKAAMLLIAEMERWGKEQGATASRIGIHTALNIERTGRFYKKMGYRLIGTLFRKGF